MISFMLMALLQAIANCSCLFYRNNPNNGRKSYFPTKHRLAEKFSKNLEGRALTAGRLNKSSNNVTLTSNLIKKTMGIPLTDPEKKIEAEFQKGKSGNGKEFAQIAKEAIVREYESSATPWVIGYSGGKDSTCVLS